MKNWSFKTVTVWALFALVTVMFSATSASAQATMGSIRGTVADTNGAVVAGATVKLKNEQTGVETSITTNNEGIYSFGSLTPGNYTVSVEQTGFKRYVQTGIAVKIGVVSGVDIPLETGAVSETVTVTSNQEEVLQTEQSQISGSIDSRRVEELPSNGAGNGLDTLALLIPGVVANRVGGTNTNGTGLSVNGNRSAARPFSSALPMPSRNFRSSRTTLTRALEETRERSSTTLLRVVRTTFTAALSGITRTQAP